MSTEAIHLHLPMPPTANNLFVNNRGVLQGGRSKSGEYRRWLTEAGWSIKIQVPGFVAPLFRGPVCIVIDCGLDRHSDIDNRIKPTLDLLVRQGVLADDAWVDDLHIRRRGPAREIHLSIAAMKGETTDGKHLTA